MSKSKKINPNKLLHLVEEIEHEYASVLQAPEDDKNLKELRAIGKIFHNLQPSLNDRDEEIIELFEAGYDPITVGQKVGISKTHIYRLMKKYEISTKPSFAYMVTSKNGKPLMFSNNLKSIFEYFNLAHNMTSRQGIEILKKNGLIVKSGKTKHIWSDLPNHVLYFYKGKWYMKT